MNNEPDSPNISAGRLVFPTGHEAPIGVRCTTPDRGSARAADAPKDALLATRTLIRNQSVMSVTPSTTSASCEGVYGWVRHASKPQERSSLSRRTADVLVTAMTRVP